MRVLVVLDGYQPTPLKAMQGLDMALGSEGGAHTYVGTYYHVDNGSVLSSHLFLLHSDKVVPVRRDGSPMTNPELMLYLGSWTDSEWWSREMCVAHMRLQLSTKKGLEAAGICTIDFEDGSVYMTNTLNDSAAVGKERLILNQYTNLVAYSRGEVYDAKAILLGQWVTRMVAVENGKYLDGLLYEAARDRHPGDERYTC